MIGFLDTAVARAAKFDLIIVGYRGPTPTAYVTIPHEVVGLVEKNGVNLVKAWRTYLGFTQARVAKKAGMSQAALSQMEKDQKNLRTKIV